MVRSQVVQHAAELTISLESHNHRNTAFKSMSGMHHLRLGLLTESAIVELQQLRSGIGSSIQKARLRALLCRAWVAAVRHSPPSKPSNAR